MYRFLQIILLITAVVVAGAQSTNLAREAKFSCSSSRPEYPLNQVNDGDMSTSWSTALGHVTDQWLQMDWSASHTLCGVAMYQTGHYVKSVEVQARMNGEWVVIGPNGTPEKPPHFAIIIRFDPVTTDALRFNFDGGAAFFEVEAFGSEAEMAELLAKFESPAIALAGDARGNLIGTLSQDQGAEGIAGVAVAVTGTSPLGAWRQTTRTGQYGFFQVAVPLGASGEIVVQADVGTRTYRQTVEADNLSLHLTPHSGPRRLSLDGTWQFCIDRAPAGEAEPQPEISTIQVPGHWEMQGKTVEHGPGGYARGFHLPASWAGERVKLRADAIYAQADILIDGKRVGGHEGCSTPFELDVTDAVHCGAENGIIVYVNPRSVTSAMDNASYFAYFELAGIWQHIELFAVEPAHIGRVRITTDLDGSYRNAMLGVDAEVANEQAKPHEGKLKLHLFDPRGKEVPAPGLSTEVNVGPWEVKNVRLAAPVQSPELWNAEQPRLYKLVAEFDGERVEQRFGFRKIEVKGAALLLNGKPLKIRGVSRLEAHPLQGRALTPEVNRKDADMIKDANFNGVRATIFPPHPDFLDDCDELGLYVENEGPVCWGPTLNDLRVAPAYIQEMAEFVERDMNHSSVIDWSLCNESSDGQDLQLTSKLIHGWDPTRVCSGTWLSLDLDVYHHPIRLERIKDTLGGKKPVLWDECECVFHGWENGALWVDLDPGMRDYWVTGLPEIQQAIYDGPNQLGTMQFSWVDDAFAVPGKSIGNWRHWQPPIRYTDAIYKLPGRGIIGDVVWGTVDGWRRPRPEFWLTKKLNSPVHIEEKPLPPTTPIRIEVANWNRFVNLRDYECRWQLGNERGVARAEAEPMSLGTLTISPNRAPGASDVLVLEFYDGKRLLDGYRLTFKPHDVPKLPASGVAATVKDQSGYLDETTAIRLVSPSVELTYDRASGGMMRCLAQNEIVMNAGPRLHILKSTSPTEDFPTGWAFAGDTRSVESGWGVLNWKGTFGKDFTGGYAIKMDTGGDVQFEYSFKYAGPDFWAREVGLDFELPLSMDRLEWDRRAEYSYYPPDHIGRPQGVAMAHPPASTPVKVGLFTGPEGNHPYGLDDDGRGCNDFRSAKRDVYWTALTDRSGCGVKVYADGNQSVRASVGVHDVSLKVLDFYGGSGGPGEWIVEGFHYGPGRLIRDGEVIHGTVKLRLLPPDAGKRQKASRP